MRLARAKTSKPWFRQRRISLDPLRAINTVFVAQVLNRGSTEDCPLMQFQRHIIRLLDCLAYQVYTAVSSIAKPVIQEISQCIPGALPSENLLVGHLYGLQFCPHKVLPPELA